MDYRTWTSGAAAVLLMTALACTPEDRSGQPETETTSTAQSVQETSTATATTTGITGGTVSALSAEDKEFITKAGMAGLYEVKVGNLALQKAASADVKAFAQRMVTDHGTANAEVTRIATAKGVALAAELAGEHQAAFDHLSMLTGAEFDKAYMQHMVADHEKDVAEFQKASTSATDADVRTFAAQTLPVLQDHAKLAAEVSKKV